MKFRHPFLEITSHPGYYRIRLRLYHGILRDWDASDFEFTEGEIELMARMEYERWCHEQSLKGWSKGAEKDRIRKVHSSLVSWEHLVEDEKEKNRAFIHELPRILAKAGFQIQRSP